MDDKMKKAVEEMAAGKEKGFNKVYSNTYNTVFWHVQDYAVKDEDIFELMHVVYVEAYKHIAEAAECEDIKEWLAGIVSKRGAELFKQPAKIKLEEKKDILEVKKAQRVYDACCILLGLTPTTIEEDKKKVIISRKVKEKVKKTVVDEVEGAVKDEVKKGIKAFIASLSMKAKVALMAGAVTTTAVTAGAVGIAVSESKEPEEVISEESEEEIDLTRCLALYATTINSYEGEPLVYPVKTAENEYTFMAEDIAKHFEDWDYAALVVEDSMPEELAVAYVESGGNGEDVVKSFSDENILYVFCTKNCNIVVVLAPKEEIEEIRSHMYD